MAYRLLDEIGAGAVGKVFRAYDTATKRYVAVKQLDVVQHEIETLLRFVAEQGIRLEHANVVTLHDWVHESGRSLLVMDLMNGGSVAELLVAHRRLPTALACEIIGQVLDGLEHVHQQGIIHRDVQPGNILLSVETDGSFRACLSDFGCALILEGPRLSRVGQLLGTVGYVAPEVRDHHEPTPAADLYGVGKTFTGS